MPCEHNDLRQLDIGRLKCVACGRVMYYTNSWREFYEKGIPCGCSYLANRGTVHDHWLASPPQHLREALRAAWAAGAANPNTPNPFDN